MTLPVQLIFDSMRMMSLAKAQAQAATRRAELAAKIRELEIAAAREQVQAQKDIITNLIRAAQHVFDRKMDFFVESFRRANDLLQLHQQALLAEQKDVRNAFRECEDTNKSLALRARMTEIANELIDLKKISALVTKDFNQTVVMLESGIQAPRLSDLRS